MRYLYVFNKGAGKNKRVVRKNLPKVINVQVLIMGRFAYQEKGAE